MSASLSDINPRYHAEIAAQMAGKIPGLSPVPVMPRGQKLRQKCGDGMNKIERAFANYIKLQKPERYVHREVGLPLANGCRYKVDFLTVHTGQTGPIIHGYEVKGFMRDDAAVKLKVAASVYPWIKFFLVTRKSQKSCWEIQEVRP